MKLIIPPPLVGLLTGAGMWGLAKAFPGLVIDGSFLRWSAIAVMGGGILIEAVSVLAFLRARTTVTPLKPEKASTLVVGGLYRVSRNPMYLGMLILLIGWALWLSNPASLLLLPVFVIYLTVFQIKPEEAVLSEKFGADYDAYCRRVRRWI
ncbi:MAG: isoprenylcysteine carboxylmethyltransferase family protein [Hyphomonas sp.]|nr:isoprenylcysteine carboxylmethyltransferase family protein [Hyphomonas sp.]